MTNRQVEPIPEKNAPFFQDRDFFRIDSAAEILGCTSSDLLHLGAVGKVELIAPVLTEGVFEWPVGADGIGIAEIDEPFRVEFGASDRVILSMIDLAKLEGVGWVVPTSFRAPHKARELLEYQQTWEGEVKEVDSITYSRPSGPWKHVEGRASLSKIEPVKLTVEAATLREICLDSTWRAVSSFGCGDIKTTIDHLFISKQELIRLKNRGPLSDVAQARNLADVRPSGKDKHGNSLRFGSVREDVLAAAIYVLRTWPQHSTKNARELATLIDEKAELFWKERTPPLASETIARLLSKAFKSLK